MDRVLSAMRYLDDRFVFRIIGRGPMTEALERQIVSEGLAGRVQILDSVDDEALARWLRSAGAFILLSEHESFSITPREALAAGANVVISDIPVHREIARAAGADRVALVPAELVGERLAEIIRSVALRPRDLTGYLPPSWDEVASRTLGVYRDVVGQAKTQLRS
jgi:glycosyltransferase involved in cell wall biosynthesis